MPKDPCSELSKTLTELALNVGARPEVRSLDDVVKALQNDIPEMNRDALVASINEATTGYARARTDLEKKLDGLKREARGDRDLRAKIAALESHLKAGTVPEAVSRPTPNRPDAIVTLAQKRDELLAAIRKSEPAMRQKYETQIANLTDRLENGVFTKPEPAAKPLLSKDLQKLEYQRDVLKKQIKAKIRALEPKTIFDYASEPFNAARAILTSLDFSAVLRQGGFIVISNPVRGVQALPDMFRAFASDEASYRINHGILARENAPLYARHKLYLSDVGAEGLSKQEELFISRIAGKIPLVRASERAYVTFLNKLRADSFDAMVGTLGRDRMVIAKEADAIANFINVATGRGKMVGSMEKAADALNAVFFSPRLVTSRFQVLLGQPMYGGTAATRKMIAKEYAKFLAGAGVVIGLGAAAGGQIEIDPRSSDFGKIRFGETRLDPLAGLSQTAVLLTRLATGESKKQDGEIAQIRGEGAQGSVTDTVGRFLRSKLSPVMAAGVDVAAGENVVGEPVTPVSAAARLITPMSFGDIKDAMIEQGVPRGAALSLVSLFGMSMNTYGERSEMRKLRDKAVDQLGEDRASGIAEAMDSFDVEYRNAKNEEERAAIRRGMGKVNSRVKRLLTQDRKANELVQK